MMNVRPLIAELVDVGRMPTDSEADVDPARADQWETAVAVLHEENAITDGEAVVLAGLFPSDETDCYGVAWSLLHLVESAPSWPVDDALANCREPWKAVLVERLRNI